MSRREKKDQRLLSKIKEIHFAHQARYGSPRIHAELKDQGECCGRKRIARIMRENNIQAKHKRKFKATTDSQHKLATAPNLLKQNFTVSAPNKIWTADITYCWTQEGWMYLAVVIDMYSRKIVGWAIKERMSSQLVIDAFLMACFLRKPKKGLIHHSDKGSQYASYDFKKVLSLNGAIQSMSGTGNCYDNGAPRISAEKLKKFGKCYTRDEGRPLEVRLQDLASNHLELLCTKRMVVSVEEKAINVRYGSRR